MPACNDLHRTLREGWTDKKIDPNFSYPSKPTPASKKLQARVLVIEEKLTKMGAIENAPAMPDGSVCYMHNALVPKTDGTDRVIGVAKIASTNELVPQYRLLSMDDYMLWLMAGVNGPPGSRPAHCECDGKTWFWQMLAKLSQRDLMRFLSADGVTLKRWRCMLMGMAGAGRCGPMLMSAFMNRVAQMFPPMSVVTYAGGAAHQPPASMGLDTTLDALLNQIIVVTMGAVLGIAWNYDKTRLADPTDEPTFIGSTAQPWLHQISPAGPRMVTRTTLAGQLCAQFKRHQPITALQIMQIVGQARGCLKLYEAIGFRTARLNAVLTQHLRRNGPFQKHRAVPRAAIQWCLKGMTYLAVRHPGLERKLMRPNSTPSEYVCDAPTYGGAMQGISRAIEGPLHHMFFDMDTQLTVAHDTNETLEMVGGGFSR